MFGTRLLNLVVNTWLEFLELDIDDKNLHFFAGNEFSAVKQCTVYDFAGKVI